MKRVIAISIGALLISVPLGWTISELPVLAGPSDCTDVEDTSHYQKIISDKYQQYDKAVNIFLEFVKSNKKVEAQSAELKKVVNAVDQTCTCHENSFKKNLILPKPNIVRSYYEELIFIHSDSLSLISDHLNEQKPYYDLKQDEKDSWVLIQENLINRVRGLQNKAKNDLKLSKITANEFIDKGYHNKFAEICTGWANPANPKPCQPEKAFAVSPTPKPTQTHSPTPSPISTPTVGPGIDVAQFDNEIVKLKDKSLVSEEHNPLEKILKTFELLEARSSNSKEDSLRLSNYAFSSLVHLNYVLEDARENKNQLRQIGTKVSDILARIKNNKELFEENELYYKLVDFKYLYYNSDSTDYLCTTEKFRDLKKNETKFHFEFKQIANEFFEQMAKSCKE